MTVFRGLALPLAAIGPYREMMKAKKEFKFNAFTSTSVEESVARGFARDAMGPGKVPCLFVMTILDEGGSKAYLHDDEFSAYPQEKEVLLGFT